MTESVGAAMAAAILERDNATEATWDEVDIEAVLNGDLDEPPPEYLLRTDGVKLLYKGKVSSIAGEPESNKGWFACLAVVEVLRKKQDVLYIDFEDGPNGIVSRLLNLFVNEDDLLDHFHYIAPEEPLNANTIPRLEAVLANTHELSLIVLDGIGQAISNQSLKSNDGDDVAAFFRVLPRGLARRYGAAVLMIDHVTKSEDGRGRYAIGSQQKLAAIDGAQFTTEVVRSFARGQDGFVTIYVTKDRPGHVRRNAVGEGHTQVIAQMSLESLDADTGDVNITLFPPKPPKSKDERESEKINEKQAEILSWIDNPKSSKKKQSILAGVGGRREDTLKALEQLVAAGHLETYPEGRGEAYRRVS